ncbi:MAG: O-succinylbenzoate--CoA ligase [Peptococcaceae bacterium BICA1-7]|nr:MAG: O-succinylbenzoate--CoA ligase [Peptococcaceae bacterium BICA1-7]HBV99028.1 long-chain fatty acid--CoA ligase [Desulfotomaculum sp.]
MNLPLKLAEQSKLFPKKEALIYDDQRLTYGELDASIKKLADGLGKIGILPGDRVLLALENCPEFVISYYAILSAHGIAVPVNPQYTLNELSVIMANALPKTVITTGQLVPLFKSIANEVPIDKGIINVGPTEHTGALPFEKVLDSGSPDYTPGRPARDQIAVLMYTAGSTGSPKGAMLTHYNLYSNATAFAQCCRMIPADRSLLIAPAYHAAAQTCVMNSTLVSGATMFIHEGWNGPGQLLESLQKDKITFYFGPPTMYALLVEHPEIEKYDLTSWRYALTGAAPTPPELFKRFEEKLGFRLMEGYGLTETSPVTTLMPLGGTGKTGSIGLPIPGVEVRIVDYEDREVPVNQIGEIIVRGPNVMRGYYNRPEETNWAMRNGWFHTGDLAYVDSDGYLFIVDRKKDLIIRGGLNIYPKEIEEVLYSHPSVFDAAVIGVPDPIMGEEVLAFVLLREGSNVTPEEIREFCSNKLARYKIPKHIRFVENLPKTTSGKLLKKELQKMI